MKRTEQRERLTTRSTSKKTLLKHAEGKYVPNQESILPILKHLP
jgi:hypothetical protein